MARSLASASSQYLEIASAVVGGPPFTVAYWFNVTDTTALHLGFGLSRMTGIGYYFVGPRGNVAGDPIQAIADNGSATGTAATSTSYSANTWQHCAGVFASSSSRAAYLNGGGKGTDATSSTFTPERTTLGRMYYNGGPFGTFDGKIAHAGLWNVALTDDEVAALAAGFSPQLVRPGSLVAYWPFGGFHGDYDRDLVGGYNLTPSGSPTFVDQPRIIYPTGPHGVQLASGGGGASVKYWLARQQSRIIGGGI